MPGADAICMDGRQRRGAFPSHEYLQDIAQAWADYAQQVMQRTTEATDALLKCRNLSDILDVQADLMRGHLQAFLDQSSKLAEISTRMAERSLVTVRHPEGTRSN